MSRCQPAFRPAPMFARCSHFDRCFVSPSAHAYPAFTPTRCPYFDRHSYPPGVRVSPGTYIRPVIIFQPLLRFDRCPASPGARASTGTHANTMLMLRPAHMSTRNPYSSGVPDSSGAHALPDVYAHLALMLAWRSYFARRSREISAAHTVLGPQEPISHDKNRATCMISGLPTRNRAFAGKILTLCIPNRLIASENACMERKSCHR